MHGQGLRWASTRCQDSAEGSLRRGGGAIDAAPLWGERAWQRRLSRLRRRAAHHAWEDRADEWKIGPMNWGIRPSRLPARGMNGVSRRLTEPPITDVHGEFSPAPEQAPGRTAGPVARGRGRGARAQRRGVATVTGVSSSTRITLVPGIAGTGSNAGVDGLA